MKILFSLICAFASLGLLAQQNDEVEFVVKKKQETSAVLYMYTDSYQSSMKKGVDYVNISQVGDTFYYYHAAISRDTSKTPTPYLAVNYFTSNDTVYAHLRYDSISESRPMFIKGNKMLTLPVSVNSFFYRSTSRKISISSHDIAFVTDSNILVTVGDTSYKCVRIAVGREAFYENGERVSKNPRRKLYFVSIYYLRKTDYLPVKTVWVEGNREFTVKSTFDDGGSYWELYKVLR